jgi:penicillin-binding protein-related factor A (putative recombinase)
VTSADFAQIQRNRAAAGLPPLTWTETPGRHQTPLAPTATASPAASPAPRQRNTGRWLEELIANSAERYRAARVLSLKKVEPACRIVGTGAARRVIFLENDWLDFAGCWTERNGRHLVVEAKSTAGERLPIQADGGLTVQQCKRLREWTDEGSACLVLWGFTATGAVLAVPAGGVFRAIEQGRKHLKMTDGVPCGMMGVGLCDFAPVLRRFHG